MLATHPSTPERITQVTQAARRIGAPRLGVDDRTRYLAAIDGIAYGDNPADGLIRGRRFIHPRLGVAFEAPEGFGLDNTAARCWAPPRTAGAASCSTPSRPMPARASRRC